MFDYKAILSYVQYQLLWSRRWNRNFALDWESLESDIMMVIWSKSYQFDQKRPLLPWIKTITINRIKNAKRDKLVQKKYAIRNFYPLKTRVQEDESIVYEPDISIPQIPESCLDDFSTRLTEQEKIVLTLRLEELSVEQIGKQINLNYQPIRNRLIGIRKKYRKYLNELSDKRQSSVCERPRPGPTVRLPKRGSTEGSDILRKIDRHEGWITINRPAGVMSRDRSGLAPESIPKSEQDWRAD